MWGKNIADPDRPQMTIWRMRIACWIPKATNTHSQYVILITFPLQQWLHERASMLRYTHTVCLFIFLDPAEFPTKDKVATHVEANSRSKLPQSYFRNPLGREGFCPVGIQPPLSAHNFFQWPPLVSTADRNTVISTRVCLDF